MGPRARTLRVIAVAAAAVTGLSACAADQQRFETVDELVSAYLDAGGQCEDFVIFDESGGVDAQTAHCGIETVLSVTESEEQTSDVATGAILRGSTVLVGGTWVVEDPAAAQLKDALGGTVLALQEGPAPEAADAGAFVFGSGSPVIRVVVDPLCDFCQRFLEANGETLVDLADAGEATVEYRMLALHDDPENGFGSSYGVNALACAADADSASVRPLTLALLQGPDGRVWTEEALIAETAAVGVDAEACITEGHYLFWAMDTTRGVREQGLPGGEHVGGVPYISIDGQPYAQNVDDAAAFEQAVEASRP